MIRVERIDPHRLLSERIQLADSPLRRLKGLLGRKRLEPDEGMLITHCRCVHTLFMAFPIDAVFFDKEGSILGLCENLKPFRFSPYFWKAWGVLELSAGGVRRCQLKPGQRLVWREI